MLRSVLILVALAGGCRRQEAATSPDPRPRPSVPVPPPLTALPVDVTLRQRSTTDVPGSSGKLAVAIDDITGGQVLVSLRAGERVVLNPVSMKPHDTATFEFEQAKYQLELKALSNALVGDDYATLTVSEVPVTAPLTEEQRIEQLIAAVAGLNEAKFVRNGREYSAKEAAEHLRGKRQSAGDAIKSAEQFIEQVASKSSLSGEAYQIRWPDGRMQTAEEFLRDELKRTTHESP
jgi:hypothetical protein